VKYKGVLWTSPPMCIPSHVVTVQACVLLSTGLPGMQTLANMLCSQPGPLGPAVSTSNWAGTCAALIATLPPAPMKLQWFIDSSASATSRTPPPLCATAVRRSAWTGDGGHSCAGVQRYCAHNG
jgi:hypothetical protein